MSINNRGSLILASKKNQNYCFKNYCICTFLRYSNKITKIVGTYWNTTVSVGFSLAIYFFLSNSTAFPQLYNLYVIPNWDFLQNINLFFLFSPFSTYASFSFFNALLTKAMLSTTVNFCVPNVCQIKIRHLHLNMPKIVLNSGS